MVRAIFFSPVFLVFKKNVSPRVEVLQASEQDAIIEVMKQAINLLVACCLSSRPLREAFMAHPSLDAWLVALLLQCAHAARRAPVANALYTICANVDRYDRFGGYFFFCCCCMHTVLNVHSFRSEPAHAFFFNKLLTFLPRVDATTQHSYHYFSLLNRLLVDACNGTGNHSGGLFQDLLALLVAKLRNQPVVEVSVSHFLSSFVLWLTIINIFDTAT